MRSAPSRRIVSPFKNAFSHSWTTSCAYSSGLPKRFGNGIDARERKRQGDDPAFRRRVRSLADLAFERRDRRGHHDDAAFTVFERLERGDVACRQARHVERTDQVHADHALEIGERHRTVAADHPARRPDAGAVHHDPRGAVVRAHVLERRRDAVRIGDVACRSGPADLRRDGFRARRVAVEDSDLRAERREPPRRRGPESRCTAADDGCLSGDVHARVTGVGTISAA
jgi:hypothetical protein